MKKVKLGGFVDENIQNINDNFDDVEKNFAQASSINGNIKINGQETSVYEHPETHNAGMIVENNDRVFLTRNEKENLLSKKDSEVYTQITPATIWMISHGMNKFPSVTVVDSANSVVVGEVIYLDKSNIKIMFSAGFSGKAYLN